VHRVALALEALQRGTATALRQHGLGQGKVVGVGHLEVLRPAGHQLGPVAQGLHGAGLVGGDRAHAHQRIQQHAQAEHLRRLRQPFVAAVHGGGHAHAVGAGDGGLQRVGQLVRQQAAHAVALAFIDQVVDLRRGHQAARCIVHQHPVVLRRTARQQGLEAADDGLGPGGATAGQVPPGRAAVAVEEMVVRRHGHQRAGQALHAGKGGQRVQHQGLAGHRVVLFGQVGRRGARRDGARTHTGAGNQSPETTLR